MFRYFAIYKPYLVLSQFSSESGKKCLKDCFDVPEDVYSVGRLDYDSEGLLLLTNDNMLKNKILDPFYEITKIYYVQVEGIVKEESLAAFESGIEINVKGSIYKSKYAQASIISEPELPERVPPIRYRKEIPTSWLKVSITEGKNRQVRKMTAKIGHPALRLVRFGIERLNVTRLNNSNIKEFSRKDVYTLLNLKLK